MAESYSMKDISVVIVTYNRAKELEITLNNLKSMIKSLNEITIVDQSDGNESRKIVKKINSRKIKYIYSKIPSITIARNKGVSSSSKNAKIICFIDDDVSVKDNYFQGILEVFNKYTEAKAVAGYVPFEERLEKESYHETIARKIFFLGGRIKRDEAKIVSSYGNRYPKEISGIINADWFPGDNMAYKTEIFKDMKFDENLLGYTVAEDIDFSYRVSKKYKNSVFITPKANLTHRYSGKAREPTARLAYLNQVDHFYFNFKNLNSTLKEKLIFFWTLFGISSLRILNFLYTRKKEDALKLKFYFSSLFYCLANLNKIRNGRVREFDIFLTRQ